ncbi:hypothetical protein [Streptomyces sp. SCSIO ZS0520]|uniref:hypothetical protein n=1 Tax=Streptomyces sp. SCSIO ZS0520 TaxID=2892996 RepID=UPI0021DA80B0|nr:hypothetical protein [Streptomyces sp. SCSIO ZS0520]
MPKTPKRSHPQHGEGPSEHRGTEQHGWSPDIDAEKQESNPSAHRSFHAGKYAPESDESQRTPPSEKEAARKASLAPSDKTGESPSRGGEERAARSSGKGRHSHGERGRSGRPSGGKDSTAYTGVDPKESSEDGKSR